MHTVTGIRLCLKELYLVSKRCRSDIRLKIKENTEISTNHMTPEIKLHLITPNCKLWYSRGDVSPFNDPFWAFYWPGGQVLSRYILDNGRLFNSKTVVDIGSGCGASAIACKLVGAHQVIANDIDPIAGECVKMNSRLNKVSVTVSTENIIGQSKLSCDIILLGDMFYDEQSAYAISDWLNYSILSTTRVLIGDPGRYSFQSHPMKKKLRRLETYDLPISCQAENNGLIRGNVWELKVL